MTFKSYRWRNLGTKVLIFMAVLGPGIITANVDNDAGASTLIRWQERNMASLSSGR